MEKKNYIVGIDIGSSNIVMIVGSKSASGEMVIDAIVSKPAQGVKAGVIENLNQVSECIKAAKAEIEEELNIRISEAYAGFSGAYVSCAPLSDHVYARNPQTGISQSDVDALFLRMKEVIAPENEVILERIPQNFTVDGSQEVKDPVGSFGRRLSSTFNFILSDKTPLDRLNMVFKLSGLQLAGAYANAMIVAEAVLSEDEKSDGAAVVDLGGSTTNVVIYHGNVIRHIAAIPIGANSINRDIQLNGIPERSVESLKKKYGSAIAEFVSEQKLIQIPSMGSRSKGGVLRRNLAAIIEARLTDIAEFVKAEIKDSGYSGRLSFGVVLTGGSASIEHIDELFRRVTGYDVRVATAECGLDDMSRSQIESPAHTAAVALLLKGAEHGACSVTAKFAGISPRVPQSPTTTPTPTPTPPIPPTRPITTPIPTPTPTPTPTTPIQNDNGGEEQNDNQADDQQNSGSKKKGGLLGWLKDGIQKATDGINKTFDGTGDDEIL